MSSPSPPKIERPICPKCGTINRIGALICSNCSASLTNRPTGVTTKSLGDVNAAPAPPAAPISSPNIAPPRITNQIIEAMVGAGSDTFREGMILRLEVLSSEEAILLEPGQETVIGRRDPSTGMAPDVDLTAHAGYKLGVSRKHAILRVRNNQLELLDLGSSNGTSVNGERITAHEPRVLRDGDQISLGKMTMRAIFQSKNLLESE